MTQALKEERAMKTELLEALKQVMSECGFLPDECFADSTFGKAYAAISKAEGRTT